MLDLNDAVPQLPRFLSGGGEMGRLVRSFDWAQTPLGPAASWPPAIQTAVSICLNSRFPMVLWLGRDFTMLYNDAWRPVLGATKHPQGLGRPGREVWPEIWHIVGAQMQSVVQTGTATWSDDLLLVVDRFNYSEEAYFTYSYSPIHDEAGAVCGVFSAVSETTRRVIGERRLQTLSELGALINAKTTEEAINLSAEVLRGNDADIPFALIYLLDDNAGRAELSNGIRIEPGSDASPAYVDLAEEDPWRISTVAQEQIVAVIEDLPTRFGTLPGGRWPAAPNSALVMPLRAPGKSELAGVLVGGISSYRRLDGDYRRFYELVAGHIATSIANARAYQEAQRRAEMLAELDRAKTAFFSNVSHEFRTPLTLMLGPTEDILGKADGTPIGEVRDLLDVVHRNGLRLQRLVNTLLDFSRIEAGRVQASYLPTDVAGFTAELASSFRSAMDRAGLDYKVECTPTPEPVYVDREMWEKIVLNLVSNAFKYTLQGSVTVKVEPRDGYLAFSVTDTGVGIPAEELPRIFDRFHRVESVAGRTHEGTGIGLALVHELVKLHGGSISVESAPGKGTTFSVSIPLGTAHLPKDRVGAERLQSSTALHAEAYVEEALRWLGSESGSPDEVRGQVEPASSRLNRSRILIADDNADMRDYVRRLLMERYEVSVAANGREALEQALDNPPDLVLADVMMPVLDGFGLLKGLRTADRTKTLPIILVSARAGEEARVEGLGMGADDYLTKPFSARELLARVEAHLSLARMRKQADDARRLSEVRLGLAMEATNMVAWEWDPENDEVVASGDLKRILGTPIPSSRESFALIHPDDQEKHRQVLDRVLREGGSYFSEFRVIQSGTREVAWVEERGTGIADETGRVVRVAGVLTDITPRKIVEEEIRRRNAELERANSELEEFAYVASHDLQEPLRTVNIYTDLLLRELGLNHDKSAVQSAAFIHDGVKRMELLIHDLLAYARVVHREQEPPSPVNVRDAIGQALTTLRASLLDANANIECNVDHAYVVGDETQLAQVFQNLLSNSLKYRRDGIRPDINISARRGEGEWWITVADNGIGFNPEYSQKIFGLFKRLHRDRYPGTGLGLAICKRIAERYGGRIWANSPGEDAGATFTIALKAADE